MKTFEHILVPTDFGYTSERAADAACALAQKLGAKVTLFHVWTVPTASYYEGLVFPLGEIEQAAREQLEGAAARMRKTYPNVQARLVAGLPWRGIVEAVTEHGCDLIVMGTHGRRGLPRMFLGSVAEKVVRLSPVPVLTVGPEKTDE